MADYPLIDVHGHLLPYNKAQAEDAKRRGFVFLEDRDGKLFMDKKPRVADLPRQIDIEFYDPEKRIALLDRYGISRQTILPVPITFESSRKGDEVLEYHRKQNDQIAAIARSYSRFIPFCCVPMQSPELAVGELKRCKEELGMSGVEINTQVDNMQLDDPNLFPIFETIQNLNLAVFVHPWDMKGTNNNWAQHICEMPYLTHVAIKSFRDGGILDKFPDLRVMFAHGGGNYFWNLARDNCGKKVRPSLYERKDPYSNSKPKNAEFYVDSNVFDSTRLEFLVKCCEERARVALGTDCPFPLGSAPSRLLEGVHPRDIVENSNLDAIQNEDVYCNNAKRWLSLGE